MQIHRTDPIRKEKRSFTTCGKKKKKIGARRDGVVGGGLSISNPDKDGKEAEVKQMMGERVGGMNKF